MEEKAKGGYVVDTPAALLSIKCGSTNFETGRNISIPALCW